MPARRLAPARSIPASLGAAAAWIGGLLAVFIPCPYGATGGSAKPRGAPEDPHVTRRGPERGALLFHARLPVSAFGPPRPDGVPVQVHGMDADPMFASEGDIDAARERVEQAKNAELFLYAGDQHLFADSSLPSHDPDATALLVQRVLTSSARARRRPARQITA